jgi:CubicO group peptidase (beta-lactamase class C family)
MRIARHASAAFAALLFSACATPPAPEPTPAKAQAAIAAIETALTPRFTLDENSRPPRGPATLTAEMQRLRVPAVSIALVEGGRVVWAKAYGLADVAANRAATPDTLFQAASISKPLTAIAAMRMVERGQLSLDEDVNTRLTSWKLPPSDFTRTKPVTLRLILSHSAGLQPSGFLGYRQGLSIPTVPQVLDGLVPANSPPVRSFAEPGSEFRYSGGGYTIAQQLMADVSGRSFSALMGDLVLRPAGMTHSTFEQPLPERLASTAAFGYRQPDQPIVGRWHAYPELAAAGLWTTPSDLGRLGIAFSAAWSGQSSQLLQQQSARTMMIQGAGAYGLGWNVGFQGREGPTVISHAGGNEGYRSVLYMWPELGQGIVIMTNSDNGDMLWREILAAAAAAYDWAP